MSSLNDWLFDKTPGIDDAPPPHPQMDGQPIISEDDEWLETPTDSYDLEEVYTLIDYRDSKGNQTRRRITLRKVARGPHAPILTAICHERRAVRAFRCDRIEGFIEDDGEVIDCNRFFRDMMMIDLNYLSHREKAAPTIPTALSVARQIRNDFRAPLSILVALARSDESFISEELDVICGFAETMAPTLHSSAHPGEVSAMTELRPLIRRMRPSRESLDGYLHKVRSVTSNDPSFREAFEDAMNDVLWADGRVAEGERRLINELGLAGDR